MHLSWYRVVGKSHDNLATGSGCLSNELNPEVRAEPLHPLKGVSLCTAYQMKFDVRCSPQAGCFQGQDRDCWLHTLQEMVASWWNLWLICEGDRI